MPVRLLIINPNTSPEITAKLVVRANALAPAGTAITGTTSSFGAGYIASRAAAAVAGHAAIDLLAERQDNHDVAILACFGDPGLSAMREIASIPVVGMAEASIEAAVAIGRFSIVTGGALWEPMLKDYLKLSPWADALASIRTVTQSGAELAADPEAAISVLAEMVKRCREEDGAAAVILGGAGLTGFADPVSADSDIAVLDSLECAVDAAIHAAQKQVTPDPARPSTPSRGLSEHLTAALLAS